MNSSVTKFAQLFCIIFGLAFEAICAERPFDSSNAIVAPPVIQSTNWIIVVTGRKNHTAWSAIPMRTVRGPTADVSVYQSLRMLEFCFRDGLLLAEVKPEPLKLQPSLKLTLPESTDEFVDKLISIISQKSKIDLTLAILPQASAILNHGNLINSKKFHYNEDGILALVRRSGAPEKAFLDFTKQSVTFACRYQREALKNESFENSKLSQNVNPSLDTAEQVWRDIFVDGFMLSCKKVYFSRGLMAVFVEFENEVDFAGSIGYLLDGERF